MPLLPITSLYAALLAFLLLYLAFRVVACRRKHKSGLGHTNDELLVAGRIHANATEYIPVTLLLLALAELNGAANLVLHSIGAVFFCARALHAWGFYISQGSKVNAGRYWGTLLTFLSMVVLGFINLYLSVPYLF